MITPSPDWFAGVAGYKMVQNGQWLWTVTLNQFAVDAANDAQNTATKIRHIKLGKSAFGSPTGGILLSSEGTTILPVARLQCSLPGSNLPPCRRSVTDRCDGLRGQCCPGLSCQSAPGERRTMCLPCLQATQTCTDDADCCGALPCTRGTCAE